jgi:hypothetical protein
MSAALRDFGLERHNNSDMSAALRDFRLERHNNSDMSGKLGVKALSAQPRSSST